MKISPIRKKKFQQSLLKWYRAHKRTFPWRDADDPYKVLLAEVLLQKTDAPKVVPVYKSLTRMYPSIEKLNKAKLSDISRIITDIGLTYRANRLKEIAHTISTEYKGNVPNDINRLLRLKGVGRYVASAVLCFAFNKRQAIVDNNVIRIIERVFGYKSMKDRPRDDSEIWELAFSLLPVRKFKDYNYGLLDFSALQCSAKNPHHEGCPLKSICSYYLKIVAHNRKPTGVDLFSGAGGLSLGFEWAGFNILYAIENDKCSAETYKYNRKRKRDLIVDTRDIKKIKPKEILRKLGIMRGDLDIVIGGPPCQGFSQSNMRTRNLANPQNQMVFKFIEFVNALKPKWFLMENVAGLNALDNGRLTELLLARFRAIGYLSRSFILNSMNFGVPQQRNRIFFIGNREGKDMSFILKLSNKKMRKPVSVKEAIGDLPRLNNGNNTDVLNYNNRLRNLSRFQKMMRKGANGFVHNNLTTKHSELAITRFENILQGENLIDLARKNPGLVSNYTNIENCHHWIYMRIGLNRPSITLNNFRKNMLIHPTQHRGLSVREAARLQSFPDKYVFLGKISYSQQQVANAVPPLLGVAIARKIIDIIK